MVNGFEECHKYKKWNTGINEPIKSYSAALGACESGITQDKMLTDQLAEKSSVYLGTTIVQKKN